MKESDIRLRKTRNRYLELVQKDCDRYFKDRKTLKNVDCPGCLSDKNIPQFEKNGFEYVTCKLCDTLFVANRPEITQLSKFYSESESSTYWVNEFFMPFLEARREKIFKPRVASVTQRFGNDPNWTVGDIGAGFGIFLEELKKVWTDSRFIAIEPSLAQAKICKDLALDVECCFVEELRGYENRFDLLTSFELFEHLDNPTFFLKKIYDLLKPGGWFFMTTLNGQGFDIQVLWDKSKSVVPPHHLNFFNPKSLTHLLTKVGFSIEKISTPGKLDWDIVEGMIKDDAVQLSSRFWNMLAEGDNSQAKEELQQWITKYNFSSHMRVLVRKPLEGEENDGA